MEKKVKQLDKGVLTLLIISSIITLGIINLAMYLIDGITPKEFFSPKDNIYLEK